MQEAQYQIAELASAAGDLPEVYRAIHRVVADLMYANNFYIALYDEERQLISWPYFVDEVDSRRPRPEQVGTVRERRCAWHDRIRAPDRKARACFRATSG